MTNRKKNKSVRLSDEAYEHAARLAADMRPKSTLQYIVEDALIQYINRIEKEGAIYRTQPDKPKKKQDLKK